jgi:hypothetical protein
MAEASYHDRNGIQVLEKVEVSDDEDNFEYEMVNDEPDDDDEDDLADALASINLRKGGNGDSSQILNSSITQVRPSVVDDFIRNFLIKAGMKRTLDCFNSEWYDLQSKGKLPAEISTPIPDIYLRNDELDQQARVLREQVDKMRQVASRAQATWDKFRKERDFHRMHHKRVVQEKNKLIVDLKRVRNNIRSYEPMIEELKAKHAIALKEKMLTKLERDRMKARIKILEDQLESLTQQPAEESPSPKGRSATRPVRKHAIFPADNSVENPFSTLEFDPVSAENFKTRKTTKGHLNSISAIAFHPRKPIFATASDDETWRLWTMPDTELVMSGEGHTSWVSGLHFHPHGSHLVTSSGDCTLKIWEFAQARCTHTLVDHTQAVWGCEFHHAGDIVASCSMDQTIRIWDLIAGKCRQSLRGHVDSVNSIVWQPFTNNICSVSGDKTVSMWDARTGLCVQTLYGHSNSCNDIAITKRGDVIISSDADGVIKAWDVRMVAELGSVETGNHPINKITIDRSGKRLMAACDDGTIKIVDLSKFSVVGQLTGHDDAVQCVGLSPNDALMVSGSSDATFRIWG